MIRPTFYGMEIAKTGLYMSQLGMDVTAHNIANVDTPGYTRQRVITQSIDPYNALYRLKPLNTYKVGGGVELKILDQIRDDFLDLQYRNEQSNYSLWATRAQGLRYIEPLYDEFSGGGALRVAISKLFDAFDELTRNPSDQEPREVTREEARSLIMAFQSTYDGLAEQREFQNQAVKCTADEINRLAEQITMLNQTIRNYEYENPMHMANDLRDKRNLLIDQLSALIDIDYTQDNGYVNISTAGGLNLVDGLNVNKIRYDLVADDYTGDADSYYELYLYDSNGVRTVLNMDNVKGGEMAGHLQLRDNKDAADPGIIYFMEQLNILAGSIVEEINAIHAKGWTFPGSINGAPLVSHSGVNFFADFTDIRTFSLSEDIKESVWNIACSSEEIILLDPLTAKGGNNEIALQLAELVDTSNFLNFMTAVTVQVADAINKANNAGQNLAANLLNIDNNRTSIGGVSLDEEMTNMIKYQHSYDANARMITTMDEMLETLINRTGVVGR